MSRGDNGERDKTRPDSGQLIFIGGLDDRLMDS